MVIENILNKGKKKDNNRNLPLVCYLVSQVVIQSVLSSEFKKAAATALMLCRILKNPSYKWLNSSGCLISHMIERKVCRKKSKIPQPCELLIELRRKLLTDVIARATPDTSKTSKVVRVRAYLQSQPPCKSWEPFQ